MNVRVVLPERAMDELSQALRDLTRRLQEAGYHYDGGLLGGSNGYGAPYEDDVFMMHPFCWCEREDCPWCGGCQADHADPVHLPDCYLWRVHDDLVAVGFTPTFGVGPFNLGQPDGMSYDDAQAIKDKVRERWCQHFGLSFPTRSAVHCTCGATEDWERRFAACECDWHLGRGPFRFGPATEAPNFWHKPTDLRVWWYKWIGRSMEADPGASDESPAALVRSLVIRPHAD